LDINRTAVQLFRVHSLAAQLLFEAANPGALETDAKTIRNFLIRQASAIGIQIKGKEAQRIIDFVITETELRYPDLLWIAELSQAATTRLLYRNTNVEDTDHTEIMALELTALLAARKGGIRDEQYYELHRSMFAQDINPRLVLERLESMISIPKTTSSSRIAEMADSVDVTIPVVPGVIRVDAKKVIKVIKKFFRK
jgi:hypothetical protein